MTKQEVEILHQAMQRMLEECDVDPHDFNNKISEGYSGRGMYGEETYALTLNSLTSLLEAMMTFPELLYDEEKEPIATYQTISKFRTDQLGSAIVLY